jgi:hypothetical protein
MAHDHHPMDEKARSELVRFHRSRCTLPPANLRPVLFPSPPLLQTAFVTVLVVFESVIYRQAGHADVYTRFERIALRIEPQNRGMFGDLIVEQNHVNAVVKIGVFRALLPLR